MLPNADYNADFLGAEKSQKEPEEYHCKKCDFFTCKIGNWKRHLNTKKHNATQMLPNADFLEQKELKGADNQFKCSCGKIYKHKQSYYRHRRTCKSIVENQISSAPEQKTQVVSTHENAAIPVEIVTMLLDKQQERFEKILETVQAGQSITGDHNNMQNFNIQLFLNNDCANASSIQDFTRQLKITMEDLSMLRSDEPKAITNIITKNLKDYTETERPFHSHRKKWYIKDKNEGWDVEGKQDGNQIVKNVKGGVAHKASSVFVENNPDFLSDDRKGQAYAETLHVAMNDVDGRDANQVLKTIEETCKL